MTPRDYRKGDQLFRKGDAATEMFLTVTGKFLVTEIGIEIPPGRVMGELGFLSPKNHRTQSVECIENGEVLTISYEKLLEIYFQKPEFGYYFLRLTSDRLLQNFARLEGIIERDKAAVAAADAAKAANLPGPKQASGASISKEQPAKAVPAIGAVSRGTASADNVIEIMPKRKAGLAATTGNLPSSASIDIKAQRRRARARAIVERHANYSAMGGFIPLPIVNVAAVTAVTVRMVRTLSKLYDEPFERNRAHAIVIGLMGGVMPTGLATVATSTIGYFIPGYNLIGLAVSSVTASAYARSIGRMIIDHFESGATLEHDRFALKQIRRWPKADLPPATKAVRLRP